MESIIQTLAFILPVIAVLSVVSVVCVNVYLKIRRQFLVKVNCWFCNQWTKVHYDQQNSFECPTCIQYNGFNSEGDYNKPIPAQHDELLNHQVSAMKTRKSCSSSNGLCHLCNNNQQLKIYQLANFIPLNEAHFDMEIEHFHSYRKQLEKAYKLCPKCEMVVKNTVHKQNCLLGLKCSQLCKKGLLLLDLNSSYGGFSKKNKRSFLKDLIHFTLISFAALNLGCTVLQCDFSDRNLRKLSPPWMLIHLLTIKRVCMTALNVAEDLHRQIFASVSVNFMSYFNKNDSSLSQWFGNTILAIPVALDSLSHLNGLTVLLPKTSVDGTALLCSVGMLLQFIVMIWDEAYSFKKKIVQLLLWVVLACLHLFNPVSKQFTLHITVSEVIISTLIILSMCFMQRQKNSKWKKSRNGLKRSQIKEKLKDLGDLSDEDDFHNSLLPSHNSTFKSKSTTNTNTGTFNCSTSKTVNYPEPTNNKQTFEPSAALQNCLNSTLKPFCDTSSSTTARDSLIQSFTSTKSCFSDHTLFSDTASMNQSFVKHNSCNSVNLDKDIDIDITLNKLHLGSPTLNKSPTSNAPCINSSPIRPKPVISPAKFKNITQNSWVAGGFWRDSNGILMPVKNLPNLSRCSSQTSGFAEPPHFNSLPSSVNNSFCGDFECSSVLSEPAYCLNGALQGRNFNPSYPTFACQNYFRHNNRTFYPAVNHEQLVYVAPKYLQMCNGFPEFYMSKNHGGAFSLNNSVPSFVNIASNATYKPASLLKNWIDKVDS